ncbi:hypothetical protein B0H13DRAFT_900544 [Mycena leptocephala]|nr:hypothetical protein B0H13DRAFT_900544 [Mycena leptocephala]
MSRLSKGTLIIPHPWPLPELPGVQNPPTSQVIPATADDGSERTAQKDALGISRITPVSFPRVCIVQRALSSTVTLAHIVNTVRTNTRRKGAVERFVFKVIQVTRIVFNLDDECNLLYINPQFHRGWDLFSLFVLIVSSASMDVLIAMLEKGNIMWQAQVDTNGTTAGFFPRFIDVRVFGKVLGFSIPITFFQRIPPPHSRPCYQHVDQLHGSGHGAQGRFRHTTRPIH